MAKDKAHALQLQKEITELESLLEKMEKAQAIALVPAVRDSLNEACDKLRANLQDLRAKLDKKK